MMDATKQKCNQTNQLSDYDNWNRFAPKEDNEADVKDEGVK